MNDNIKKVEEIDSLQKSTEESLEKEEKDELKKEPKKVVKDIEE